MDLLEAIILGIIQGLTEFLPVSSSGHLELGQAILGHTSEENLQFALVVHGATVLSTIVVFHKDIRDLFAGLFQFKWNDSSRYTAKLLLSMLPVGVVGLFFKDEVEALFGGNLLLVGSMLLVTGALLSFTHFAKDRAKPVGYGHAWWIGLAQAIAVLPGISRSGSTIATALLLGVDKKKAARFSFLMVLLPILGANLKDVLDGNMAASNTDVGVLIAGFLAAFISGVVACRWMIALVNRGKLIYFALYCFAVGLIAISTFLLQ